MISADTRGFKEKLEEEEKKLLGEISHLKDNLDFGDDVDSLEEEPNETEEFGNMLSVKNSLDDRLRSIRGALERIKKGGYGVCTSCKKTIEPAVLEADPTSTLCRQCKMDKKE